jgi:AhpD family alkylhydroperoxidase
MTEMFGFVPEFIKTIPENLIDGEWEVFKRLQIEEHHIPPKFKELGGLMVSAVTKCKYCVYFHTAFAKLMGASDEEIQEAIHYAKATAGWSAYINGTQQDYKSFCKEIDNICDHVGKAMAAHAG